MAKCASVIFISPLSLIRQSDLSYFEIIFSSTFFQLALYIAIRLAHRGFTVGELGLVCFGGIALSMELLNLTKAKV